VTRRWARSLSVVGLFLAVCAPSAVAASPKAAPGREASGSHAFPVTVISGDGAVRIPSRPTRILCLSASATQMLYAIGAGEQVVGVDKYSSYPADAPRTKFTGAETSAEAYLSLKPDLVIVAYESGKVVQQLRLLKIPVLVLPPATTFADVDGQLAELGAATGHAAGTQSAESVLRHDLSSAERAVGAAARGETYYVELDTTYYTATSKTFIGAEFSLFGMANIADAAGRTTTYPQISAEYVLKENPDYVFLADTVCCHQDARLFGHRPGFRALAAVRHHHVVAVDDSVASQWGPHTIETFVSMLARTLRR